MRARSVLTPGGRIQRQGRASLALGQLAVALMVVFGLATALPGASASAASARSAHLSGFAGPASQVTVDPRVNTSSAQFQSRNWDGYITYVSTEGTDFDAVQAEWTQPTVTCPKSNAWTVFWVGLDGWWNDTVEQGGTSAECVGGVPRYETWWEMYPTNAITAVFAISPGDEMTASVTYKPATSTFVITVSDATSDKSFTEHEQCASDLSCDRSSADVIAEDVGKFSGGYYPLADYKTMKFTNSVITNDSKKSGSFTDSKWSNAAVTEESGSTTYATVSPLNSKGDNFSATWQHV